jgi:hypothetical protein
MVVYAPVYEKGATLRGNTPEVSGLAIGCAFLDKVAPDQKGNPTAQVGEVMQNVANDPAAKAVAGAVPYGDVALYIFGGIGALLGGVAGVQTKRHADDHKEVKRLRELHAKLHAESPIVTGGSASG